MVEIVSNNPFDYIKVALALETLAYHNKNCLCSELAHDNCKFSETIQNLLTDALNKQNLIDD